MTYIPSIDSYSHKGKIMSAYELNVLFDNYMSGYKLNPLSSIADKPAIKLRIFTQLMEREQS